MADKTSSGNPILDIWLSNQQQFLDIQSQWINPGKVPQNPFINAGFLDRSLQNWQSCEAQYKHWTKTAENWISSNTGEDAKQEENYSTQALNYLLNPTTFMQSGFKMMDQVFHKLVNGPDFADIGMLEKKMLKSGKDWQAFNDASHQFQEVVAAAWLRAYQHFSDEFFDRTRDKNISPEALLQRWLKIADDELVGMLRSDEFLEAQRNMFAKSTDYKLKCREFTELWCENHNIPTRSEVDELHKVIYELRREVRTLKRKLEQVKDSGAGNQPISKPPKEASKPAVKNAPVKTKASKKAQPKRQPGKTKTVKRKISRDDL